MLRPIALAGVSGGLVAVLLSGCGTTGAAGQGAVGAPEPAALFYIATNGNDAWSGRLARPNANQTDGPFATLERARDELRKLKQTGGLPPGGVAVELRGGVYELKAPFALSAEDSGTEASPVTYRARRGEEVRLVGGKVVTGWGPVTDPTVLARLDEGARTQVLRADLRAQGITDYGEMKTGIAGAAGAQGLQPYDPGMELFFQDKPMTLARWPNEGFVKVGELLGGSLREAHGLKGDNVGKFTYEGDRPARWVGEKDIMLHGYWFWDWSDQRQKVASIDTTARVITMTEPYHYFGYRKSQRYYAYNLLPELDLPGEYWIDREAGVLYFWPPAPIAAGKPMVSVLSALVTLSNTTHITIQGFVMEATRGTPVSISGGTGNLLAGCTLRNTSKWAVNVSGTNNGVVGCDIYNTGEGGITLSGGDRKTLTPCGLYAENNLIYEYSRICRVCRPALSLSGVGIRVAHNLIHNAPHMAINFGGNDHIIEFNEIHSVCYETGDAGAIYAGYDWTMRGHQIRYNYMHHVKGPGLHGANGVYLDDMFSSATLYGNVFQEVNRAAFIGGGRDNVVENNLFVDCKPALHVDARAVGWAKASVENQLTERLNAMPYQQPPWSLRFPQLLTVLQDEPGLPKGNLVTRNICFGGVWDEIEKVAIPLVTMQDNLVGEDPHFVDAEHGNFQLKDDSPAYGLGFQRIPMEKIGLYESKLRASWPVQHEVRQAAPHKPAGDKP
jgi:hypothetical protein